MRKTVKFRAFCNASRSFLVFRRWSVRNAITEIHGLDEVKFGDVPEVAC
jgi:hypothetical protein